MRIILTILVGFLYLNIVAQDTLRVMHYNLLNFGNNTGYCNQNNNNYQDKTAYLKTIVAHVKPDIITVNEISNVSLYHDYILNNALNVDGISFYQKGDPPNFGGSNIINQIFYNSEKLELTTTTSISTNYRDMDIFKMQFSPVGQQNKVEINCVVAHLKAGNDYEDEVERASETNKLMNYLSNTNASGNFIISGDFNVYTSSEQAFKNLLFHSNVDIRFYDPVNELGAWNNNPYFADVHTQSTHTSSNCFAGGGMDDRFDFILASDEIINGTEQMKYLSNSYKAIGQDGQHFNSSLISSPTNTAVPPDVLNALYGLSDHLPVVMEILVGDDLGFLESPSRNSNIVFSNPIKDQLEISFINNQHSETTIKLFDLKGHIFYSVTAEEYIHTISIPTSNLIKGMYILKITDRIGNITFRKVIKL